MGPNGLWEFGTKYLMPIFRLGDEIIFPPVHLTSGKGILAIGGDLSDYVRS